MSALLGPLLDPLYEGSGSSDQVPGKFDCALNGRVFMYDTRYMSQSPPAFRRSSVPLLKVQQDSSGVTSERSLNPEDLARAAAESWHHGAGQTFFDRPESDPYRFRSSKGIDPWAKGKIQLLPATSLFASSAAANLHLAPTSTRLYYLDDTAVKYDDDLSGAPSSMTGSPGNVWKSITTNGYDVWATDGTNIYHWVRGDTAVGAAYNAQDVDLLVWVRGKGRLMGALNTGGTRSVFNITGAGAPTDIAPSIISADFTWVGFAEGKGVILGAGYQGDKSLVFRWGIKSDGTGLDAAVPALADGLPDGEVIRSIYSYQSFVVLGTDVGVRFCTVDDEGNLILGALIELDAAVRCFEGQGPDIWFGWTNCDSVSTGLGRIHPQFVTDEGVPAYASDLMATAQGNVVSVCTFLGRRVFTVSGVGVYVESTDLVTEGSIDSGLITHGLPDAKEAIYLTVSHDQLDGTVEAFLAADGGSFTSLGTSSEEDSVEKTLSAGEQRGTSFEIRITLDRAALATAGPVLTRWTLESNFAPGRGEIFVVFLLLREEIVDRVGGKRNVDVLAEYQALLEMTQSGAPIAYLDAGGLQTAFLDDYDFYIEKATARFFEGTFAARLRRPRRRII